MALSAVLPTEQRWKSPPSSGGVRYRPCNEGEKQDNDVHGPIRYVAAGSIKFVREAAPASPP
jgi:hypothetical protein